MTNHRLSSAYRQISEEEGEPLMDSMWRLYEDSMLDIS